MIKFEKVKNCPFSVKLPSRSTAGSAGYDFFAPVPVFHWGRPDCICKDMGESKDAERQCASSVRALFVGVQKTHFHPELCRGD